MDDYISKEKFEVMTQNSLRAMSAVQDYSLNNPTVIPSVDMNMEWADRFIEHRVEGFEVKPYIYKYLTSKIDEDRY